MESTTIQPAYEESLRTTDLLAREIFNALRVRSIHERRFVLRALQAAGRSDEISGPKEQAVFVSLATYRSETELTPSFAKYEAWRKSKDDPSLYSATRIQRQYSTWSNALDALGFEPKPDPTALRLLSRGQGISAEDALLALRDCAAALKTDNFSIAEYEAWAKAELLSRGKSGQPIPISKSIMTRRFGSFRKAKMEAGLDPNVAYHQVGSYTEEELLDALRLARQGIEGRLSTARYSKWRKAKQAEATAKGEVIEIPCSFTLDQRFGGWLKAVSLVEDLPVKAHDHRGPPIFQADWIAEHLVAAYEEIGEPFYVPTYRRWVKEKREKEPGFPPADYYTIRRRANGWNEVRDLVREAHKTGDMIDLIAALEYNGPYDS
ncbi:MAG: hypothetical protein IPK93_04545 [Solirubrobacterales bacterium]|nr:hypothetical protein [Solirubrobacterales bacterium]